MNDNEIAQKIRRDLKEAFPLTVFHIEYTDGKLHYEIMGGSNYKDIYPDRKDAIAALVDVIRKTLPYFTVTSYDG
jgi:hypothetical protein